MDERRTWVDDLGPLAGIVGGGVALGSEFGWAGSLVGGALGLACFLSVRGRR